MNIRKRINTIFFQTLLTSLLGFSLIGYSAFQIREAVSKQQETQSFVDAAALQRADVFRLAELARRLNGAQDEREQNAIVLQIQTGITEFDERQIAFRDGDKEANIVPAESAFVLPILDNLDEAWLEYKTLLLDIVANPDQINLVNSASRRASSVFVQADRLGRTANNDLAVSQAQVQETFAIMGGMAVLMLIFLANLFYRILRGLGRLERISGEFTKGNYAVRAPADTYTEIVNVGNSLNQLADAVLAREQDLLNINETLEQRVKARTVDLEKATEEAKQAVRLKDEFLSIMSHELRTPLNAIMGYQGLLLMVGELNKENESKVQRTLTNAKQLLGLINDILDISRLESNRMSYYPVDVNINSFIERVKAQFDVINDEKKLEFNIKVDTSVPSIVKVDEDVLTKIVNNLLSNAFKFTDKGQVSLDINYDQANLLLTIKDTGIGIPSHLQELVFEKFRQVDATTKRKYGGSGLGLSIVQSLLKEIGGTVRLTSVANQGTEFKIMLPVEIV